MADRWMSEDFDEFSLLKEYADYEGIPWQGQPRIERRSVEVRPGQQVSALAWGEGDAEVVFLHGGGQNAHTWDSVALALGRPALAVDLPGHGHSDWRADRDYWPVANAEAVATLMEALAPRPKAVVGMSLGGLTTIRLAATRPDLVAKAVVVDVSPGVGARSSAMTDRERGPSSLIGGPRRYESFEAMVEAVAALQGREPESAWRGVCHNAKRFDDGSWGWRYDQLRDEGAPPVDFVPLWEDVAAIEAPIMLVRGGRSLHVHDDDVAAYVARQPHIRCEVVDGAGHSVQGQRPVPLARLINEFVYDGTLPVP
jgi:pimeloyl-ACP methyl ester carboxylesterase